MRPIAEAGVQPKLWEAQHSSGARRRKGGVRPPLGAVRVSVFPPSNQPVLLGVLVQKPQCLEVRRRQQDRLGETSLCPQPSLPVVSAFNARRAVRRKHRHSVFKYLERSLVPGE